MREEDWECAVNAFHRVVNLGARFTCFTSTRVQILTQKALIEPESYESWGNIGAIYMRQGSFEGALHAFQVIKALLRLC